MVPQACIGNSALGTSGSCARHLIFFKGDNNEWSVLHDLLGNGSLWGGIATEQEADIDALIIDNKGGFQYCYGSCKS